MRPFYANTFMTPRLLTYLESDRDVSRVGGGSDAISRNSRACGGA